MDEPDKPSEQAPSETAPDEKKFWLDNPANVRKFIKLLLVACAVLFVIDLLELVGLLRVIGLPALSEHRHFTIEHWTGFYSFYGFLGCTVIVLTARAMRPLLMRREDYYDR